MKKISNVLKNIVLGLISINLIFSFNLSTYAEQENKNIESIPAANVNLNDIAYNGKSTYVAVGMYGEIEVSSDGIHTKTIIVPKLTCNLTAIKWTGTHFVVISDNGLVLSSKDGYTWTISKSVIPDKINNFITNRECIVLVGDNGKIYTSTSNLKFSLVNSNTTENLNDIIRTKTEFVAVGDKGTIVISKDGKAWNKVKSGAVQDLVDISWNGKRYVAVGGDAILSSSDSKKWIIKHFDNEKQNVNVNLTKIAWNKKEIVVGGTDITYDDKDTAHEIPKNSFVFFNSTDGINWHGHLVRHSICYRTGIFSDAQESKLVDVNLSDIVSANGKFIVFGYASTLESDSNIYSGEPMLIGYIDKDTDDYDDILDNNWWIDFFPSTSYEVWETLSGTILTKVFWDGKRTILVGNTIIKYNDVDGKSYVIKRHSTDDSRFYNGTQYINYDLSQYSIDGEYWTYDNKFSNKIIIDDVILKLAEPYFWTGKVTISKADACYLKECYSTIVYSYDGVNWHDTKLHGNCCELNKKDDTYIAHIDGVNYESTDGINWTKQQ